MADTIRLGIIGANMRSQWASRSHSPALLASPDWEVTAVGLHRLLDDIRRASDTGKEISVGCVPISQ